MFLNNIQTKTAIKYMEEGESIFVTGVTAAGKSELLKDLQKQFPNSVLVNYGDMILNFRKVINKIPVEVSFGQKKVIITDDVNLIEYYRQVPILFIDDLGCIKDSDFNRTTLYLITDYRKNESKQTIYSTNLSLKEMDEMDARLSSRIREWCKTIIFTEPFKETPALVVEKRTKKTNTKSLKEFKQEYDKDLEVRIQYGKDYQGYGFIGFVKDRLNLPNKIMMELIGAINIGSEYAEKWFDKIAIRIKINSILIAERNEQFHLNSWYSRNEKVVSKSTYARYLQHATDYTDLLMLEIGVDPNTLKMDDNRILTWKEPEQGTVLPPEPQMPEGYPEESLDPLPTADDDYTEEEVKHPGPRIEKTIILPNLINSHAWSDGFKIGESKQESYDRAVKLGLIEK